MLAAPRAQWGSRIGFILAAAGSAVGLGNIWKFPYVTGENGGGVFILAYVICVLVVGLPVMSSEILIGRATQKSPVSAFRELSQGSGFWPIFGWLGVFAAASLLSYYSVIAGWAMHYAFLSVTGQLAATGVENVQALFQGVLTNGALNLFWHFAFMLLTVGVVVGGVSKGLDRWSRILMPALLAMLLGLVIRAAFLPGFGQGLEFAFGIRPEEFHASSVLVALGQAFFSLSIGMGTMITYGSYLRRDDDIMGSSIEISALDTLVALMASIIIFPIIFSFPGLEPTQGPSLLFASIPTGMMQMPFASLLMGIFFVLLVFAALTSAISLLEVPVAVLMDELGWERKKAATVMGLVIFVYGVPSALGGSVSTPIIANWFDNLDYLVSNILFPLGGIGISMFTGWRMEEAIRHDHFLSGSKYKVFYSIWLTLLRFVVPVGIVCVFLNAIGVI
ncbi:MAG: sodium-dependent transporter [Bryobacterales bacterium]|nr:sodium-dependent transporter [Acidobacteriota bacterium]MCB9384602.1 sodium-dependent transporter [Bryobacterales bacterium]